MTYICITCDSVGLATFDLWLLAICWCKSEAETDGEKRDKHFFSFCTLLLKKHHSETTDLWSYLGWHFDL